MDANKKRKREREEDFFEDSDSAEDASEEFGVFQPKKTKAGSAGSKKSMKAAGAAMKTVGNKGGGRAGEGGGDEESAKKSSTKLVVRYVGDTDGTGRLWLAPEGERPADLLGKLEAAARQRVALVVRRRSAEIRWECEKNKNIVDKARVKKTADLVAVETELRCRAFFSDPFFTRGIV